MTFASLTILTRLALTVSTEEHEELLGVELLAELLVVGAADGYTLFVVCQTCFDELLSLYVTQTSLTGLLLTKGAVAAKPLKGVLIGYVEGYKPTLGLVIELQTGSHAVGTDRLTFYTGGGCLRSLIICLLSLCADT